MKELAQTIATAEVLVRQTFSKRELEIVKANLRYALENCPVDGGIQTEDGNTSTSDSIGALLGRLGAMGTHDVSIADFREKDVVLLRGVMDYAISECPFEGEMMLQDGTMISKSDLRELRKKVVSPSKNNASEIGKTRSR